MNRKKNGAFAITRGDRALDLANMVLIACIVFLCLYPFLNVVAMSLSSSRAILSGDVSWLPIEPQLVSFRTILAKKDIWHSMVTTVTVAVLGTAIGLAITTGAAYALSRKRLRGRGAISVFILFTMFFGGGLIPTFLTVKQYGLLDSVWALILPAAANVFNFIVMRSFFAALPESLEEAAILDGCNDLDCLLRIVLPLSLPILATIGLFYAVGYWNDYFASLLYISTPSRFTLQLKLRQLIFTEELSQMNQSSGEGLGRAVVSESLKAASIVVSTLPIIVVYPWLQRYFVKGVMLGSVKG